MGGEERDGGGREGEKEGRRERERERGTERDREREEGGGSGSRRWGALLRAHRKFLMAG